jgi:hypothetical protein
LIMVNCPKCGAEVGEDMAFCPKCGASLQAGKPEAPAPMDWRRERRERRRNEKGEKNEKEEKHEKGGQSFIGPLIGGLVLILIGVSAALSILGYQLWNLTWPIFIIVIGLIIIISALARTAKRRNPPT